MTDILFFGSLSPLISSLVKSKVDSYIYTNIPNSAYMNAEEITSYPHHLRDLVLDQKTLVQLKSFVLNLKKASSTGKGLPRLALYGPPGTGKTEIARRLVNEGNFRVKMLTGGDMAYLNRKELAQILNYIKKPKKSGERKIIFFIDEAEDFFRATASERRDPALQTFLAATGSRNPEFTVIWATNFIAKFDDAAFRRADYKISLDLPNAEERPRLFKFFMEKNLKDTRGKITFDYEVFHSKPEFLRNFLDHSAILNPDEIRQITEILISEALFLRTPNIEEERVLYWITDLEVKKQIIDKQKETERLTRRQRLQDALLEQQLDQMNQKGGDGKKKPQTDDSDD